MIEMIIVFVVGIIVGGLVWLFSGDIITDPNTIDEKYECEIVKWGYTHGIGDSKPSMLWITVKNNVTGEEGDLVFDRNEEFEENYRHLQY